MSFFSDEQGAVEADEDEEPSAPPPWDAAPERELPVVLPIAALLSKNDQAALVLSGVSVFSNGVELTVAVKVRRATLSDDDWDDLLDRTRGFGHRRTRRLSSSSRLRVGLVLADGVRVLTERPATDDGEPSAPVPRLHQTGGSGSGSDRFWVSSWRFWLWPLPPDGPLTVIADWPQLGLAEGSVVVDGHDLAAVADQVREIWADADPPQGRAQPIWSIGF